jgi:hypothetical protein
MADQDSGAKQTATGIGIAQAAEGGTASVSIGFTADDVKQILSAALVQQSMSIPPGASVVLEAPPLNMEPPLRPEPALRRLNLEDRVKESLSKGRSVVLCGDFGSGRTELARKVSEKYDRTHWLDIQANPHLQPQLALELFLQKVSSPKNARSQKSESQREPAGTALLVIDNVEAAVLQPEFEARVRGLANPNNDRPPIILISLHPLPNPLSALFNSVEVERFNSAEVAALVKLYGAPPRIFTAELLNLVVGVTHGMPYLLTLLLKHWISKNWATDDDSWLELLRSDFATDLRAETQRRLLAMQEPSSCELLYRLTLLLGPFSEKDVIQIAAVEPAIDRAGERLQSLIGVWLPRVNNRQWRTSPLLSGAGEANLIRTTQHAVHSAAANWIFAKRTLNQTDTSEVILHLLQAERFNDAAEVYIRALHALLEADVDAYPGTLLSLWKGLPIPEQINLGPRILIRGLQVANALRRSEDYLPAIEDLKRLVVRATAARDRVSVYGASVLVAMRLVQTETRDALPFISMAAQEERFLPEETGFLNNHAAAEMFWVAAMKANMPSDIREWMTEVNKLTDDERAALMEVEFAAESASKMFDSLWWKEQDKPDQQRKWTLLLEFLRECEAIASGWRTPLISACILRSELSIRIVHLRDIEAGGKDAERFYVENQDYALALFILADGTASWLLDVDRWDLASTWLTRAYQYAGLKLPLHQQLNCLRYGHLLLKEGAPSRIPFERALAIGNESKGLTLFNQLKAKAEFAIFLWKTGEVNELYSTWSDVVRGVLEHREDNSAWKHFFMLAMNNTTFFWSEAARSRVNEGVVSEPVPSMFIGGYQSLADRYRPELVFMMPGGMAQWADHLGKLSEAAEWVKLTEKIGREDSKNDLAKMYQMHAIPFDIKEGRFMDALVHASEASKGFLCQVPAGTSPNRENEPAFIGSDEPTARRTRFARFVPLHLAVFPSLLAIEIDAQRHPETVRKSLETLVADMQTKRMDDPEVWDIGISVFQEILHGHLRWADLRETTPAEDDNAGLATHLLRSFGLWITANDSPRDLLIAQGNKASFLAAYFPQMGSIGTIICISIARMWAAKIESCPFYFRQPRDTASRILELADGALLGELIVVLADSVGVGFQNTTRDIFRMYILRQ